MQRRRFVATVGSGLCCSFAGCAGSGADERGPKYALELIRISDGGIRGEFALTAGDVSNEKWNVFSDALEGTARTYGHTPLDDGRFVEYGGRFYRVTVEETGRKTHERPILRAEVVDSDAAKRNAVDWSTYSWDDSTAVRRAGANAAERRTDGETGDGEPDDDEDFYVLRNRDPELSELLPEPKHEYVEYGGDVIRLVVEQRRFAETEYTYTTAKVADSGTAFREFVREEIVTPWLDRSTLSGGQRDILEQARSNGYAESGDLSEGYRTLLERLFEGDPPERTTGNHVGYEDRIYRAQLKVSGR